MSADVSDVIAGARDASGAPLTPLMLAAGVGAEGALRALLAEGARVNALDDLAGASALHKACQGGHLGCVRLLVEHGAWIDVQATSTGHTPLVEAIWFKSDAIVDYLIQRDARIELKTYYGFTIDDHITYALAVSKGLSDQDRLERIRHLVARRRERDAALAEDAVLVKAALGGDREALRRGLSGGASVDSRYPIVGSFEDGHTALLVAARQGHQDLVADLLAAGADVNAVEPTFGAVPLHKATYNGHADITALLAKAPGIDLDYQGPSNGYTPLHDALWHGFGACAAVLLDAGARTDIVAYDGKLPVDLAVEKLGPDDPVSRRLGAMPAAGDAP